MRVRTENFVETTPAALVEHKHNVKNVALFLAAPFIGLVYALALPVVGVATLLWLGARALTTRTGAAHA